MAGSPLQLGGIHGRGTPVDAYISVNEVFQRAQHCGNANRGGNHHFAQFLLA
jgi:hypothetical protein